MGTRTKTINPTFDNHQRGVDEFDFNCAPVVQAFSHVYGLYAGAPPPQAEKKKKKMTMQHVTFSTTCVQRWACIEEALSQRCNWHFGYARLQKHSEGIQRNETCKLLQCVPFDVAFFFCFLWNRPKKGEFSPPSVLTRKPEPRRGNCCSPRYGAVAHFQSSTTMALWFRPTLGKTWSESAGRG